MARVLLLGSGQSGSTLVGMALAASPVLSMLGEIAELSRVDPEQHVCTCGAPFGDCAIWGRMFAEGMHQRPYDAQVLQRALAVAAEVEGTPHVLDSCKSSAALSAQQTLGLDDTRLLYLVRHPCGYVYSQLHNGLELNYALDAWIDEQTRLLQMLTDWGRPWQLIRYEDFARDPAGELTQIVRFLSLPLPGDVPPQPWDFSRTPWGARQHVLSGASWRLEGRPVQVQEDVRWRHALMSSAVREITAACRPLLERLGYPA